jgi:Alw26I/Eco31I/Esp3I family type II restriction endonuclease
MAKKKQIWHPNYIKYINFIVSHQNYSWLPSEIGEARKKWAAKKAKEFKIPELPGFFAKVMLEVHPTKKKVCQVCGKELSLYYLYPNHYTVKAIKNIFGLACTENMSINDIVKKLLDDGINKNLIMDFLLKKSALNSSSKNLELNEILVLCEIKCREGYLNMLGPGSMSNFPDRFDGFHSYNRCCRGKNDTGRFSENMKTYSKDRRAYEYWSDGNIHAANKFMKNPVYFNDTSADHLGPISLGFVHDPHYIRPMSRGDNSIKRDRLLIEDINKIIAEENNSEVCAMSWYSAKIWDHIKRNINYMPWKTDDFRDALKKSIVNFMYILWEIITNCGGKGEEFLIKSILIPKMEYFKYDYNFDMHGKIIEKRPRKINASTKKEIERFVRIAFKSIENFHSKKNRNLKPCLSNGDLTLLKDLCDDISCCKENSAIYKKFINLVKSNQQSIISKI